MWKNVKYTAYLNIIKTKGKLIHFIIIVIIIIKI